MFDLGTGCNAGGGVWEQPAFYSAEFRTSFTSFRHKAATQSVKAVIRCHVINGLNRKENHMSTIYLHQTTTLTPGQYIAGLTDFGPGRSKLFGNSADEYLKVHRLGEAQADVTEGSGGIWERLHYDWSDSSHVVLTTTDSNVWGGASGHIYDFTSRPDGATDIDVAVVREGKNLKGWLLGLVLGTIGRRVLERAFVNSVKAIEARNAAPKARGTAGRISEPLSAGM
jgi:hypothetical protein